MEGKDLALTQVEALEILAYLLSSAHGALSEEYGVYRLASAADRLARLWMPHADGEMKEFLNDLGTNMQSHAANMSVDPEGFSTYLSEVISALAEIVKKQEIVGV
jgi:hypothetical protein